MLSMRFAKYSPLQLVQVELSTDKNRPVWQEVQFVAIFEQVLQLSLHATHLPRSIIQPGPQSTHVLLFAASTSSGGQLVHSDQFVQVLQFSEHFLQRPSGPTNQLPLQGPHVWFAAESTDPVAQEVQTECLVQVRQLVLHCDKAVFEGANNVEFEGSRQYFEADTRLVPAWHEVHSPTLEQVAQTGLHWWHIWS